MSSFAIVVVRTLCVFQLRALEFRARATGLQSDPGHCKTTIDRTDSLVWSLL